ncbi:2'-5' RNA ligase family protein, partial [Pseudomonas sp. SIMBA_067]
LALPAAAPRLLLDRLQVWQRASALVLEAHQTPPALLQLVYGLQQALLPLGVEAVSREYRPHLTLSRDFRGQPPEASSAPEFYLAAR